jgi:alpha-L-fucosidase
MPDGRIEPRQAERLREIGAWLREHRESVYGTRGGPFKPGQWGASTRNANRIYLHLFEADQRLELPALTRKVVGSRVLGAGQLKLSQTPEGITVSVPPALRQDVVTVVVLDLDGSAMDLPAVGVKTLESHRR